MNTRAHRRAVMGVLPILVVGAAAVYSVIGQIGSALRAPDEIRVAAIAREMSVRADPIVPHLGGEPFLEKPPLYFWAVSQAFRAFGFSAGAARLASAVAAFLTMVLVFDMARRTAGSVAGLLAMLILASTSCFYRYAHRCMVDSWLALFVTLGFWGFVVWLCRTDGRSTAQSGRPRAGELLAVYAGAALACLTKGPVGPILLAGPLILWVILSRRREFWRTWIHLPGLLMLIVAAGAWPLLLYLRGGRALLDEYLVHNVLYRITAPASGYGGGHEAPVWYYVFEFPRFILPWVVAFPAVLFWLVARRVPATQVRSALYFLASVFPVGALLLSLPATKRPVYLLPVVIPLAVVIGAWVESTRSKGVLRAAERVTFGILGLLAGVIPGLLILFPGMVRRLCGKSGPVGSGPAHTASPPASARWAGPFAVGAVFCGFLLGGMFGLDKTSAARDLAPMAHQVGELNAPTGTVTGFRLDERSRAAIAFYTGVPLVNLQDPDGVRRYVRRHPHARILVRAEQVVHLPRGLVAKLNQVRSWRFGRHGYKLFDLSGAVGE